MRFWGTMDRLPLTTPATVEERGAPLRDSVRQSPRGRCCDGGSGLKEKRCPVLTSNSSLRLKSNPILRPNRRKVSVASLSERLMDANVKLPIFCSRVCSLCRQHSDLEVLISKWSIDTHTFITSWGEFIPTLKDMLQMRHLSLFGEANAMGLGKRKTIMGR